MPKITIYVDEFHHWDSGKQCVVSFAKESGWCNIGTATIDGVAAPTIFITGGTFAIKFKIKAGKAAGNYSIAGMTFTQYSVPPPVDSDDFVDDHGFRNFPTRESSEKEFVVGNSGEVHGSNERALYKFSITIQKKGERKEGFVDPGIENQD